MNLNTMFSEVIPTMFIAWLSVILFIITIAFSKKLKLAIFVLIKPLIQPKQVSHSVNREFS